MMIGLPAIRGVSAMEFEIERNVAMPKSPTNRAFQRQVRDGDRWVGTLNFQKFDGDDAGVLEAFLTQMTSGDNHLFLSPPQNSVRGNWNPQELVTNGDFKSGLTTGWTANNGDTTLTVNARRLKVRLHAGGVSNGDAIQNVTMEVGKPHVLLIDAHRGNITSADVLVRRQSDHGIEGNASLVAPARGVILVTPTVAPMYTMLRVPTTVLGDHNFWSSISLCRCLQVNGAAQTGKRVNVDGGPASINAALKAGEFVTIPVTPDSTLRYQLVKLTEDFDTDSNGAGAIAFEPALRAAPADNAAVIVRNPFGMFTLADHRAPSSISPPLFRDFAVRIEEDVTP
jgi:hypothetical protein